MVRPAQTILTLIPASAGAAAAAAVSVAALAAASGMSRHDVVNTICRLNRRGLVTSPKLGRYQRTAMGDKVVAGGVEIKPGPKRPGVDAGGKKIARPLRSDRVAGRGTLRDRLWHALRQVKKSTLPELLELAAKGSERAADDNARRYLAILVRYGVVGTLAWREPGIAKSSPGFLKYVLLRDLGPKAPVYRVSVHLMIDRNKGDAAEAIMLLPKDAAP